jgi:hypothetical protein
MRKGQKTILAVHGAIELIVGFALIGIAFALGFQAPGLIVSVVLGAALIGIAIASTSASGRGSLPPSVHADVDLGMALGLLAAAVVLGFGGQGIAFIALIAGGLVQLTLTALTRYGAATA